MVILVQKEAKSVFVLLLCVTTAWRDGIAHEDEERRRPHPLQFV